MFNQILLGETFGQGLITGKYCSFYVFVILFENLEQCYIINDLDVR